MTEINFYAPSQLSASGTGELADSRGPKIDMHQNSGSSGQLCFKHANTTTETGNPSAM